MSSKLPALLTQLTTLLRKRNLPEGERFRAIIHTTCGFPLVAAVSDQSAALVTMCLHCDKVFASDHPQHLGQYPEEWRLERHTRSDKTAAAMSALRKLLWDAENAQQPYEETTQERESDTEE